MFGWEFPPHISGGLGTACYGLSRGLIHNDVEVLFVVPKMYGDEEGDNIRLISASEISFDTGEKFYHELLKKFTMIGVQALLIPYVAPEEFARAHGTKFSRFDNPESGSLAFPTRFEFSGKYDVNLFNEVARYAVVAAKIATMFDFDVIHAHDWLTYPAAIAAREVSGKPFVAHVHATEFDRSGDNINQEVYNLEKHGMMAADKIIAVSNFTRSIIINRYGIPPEKVVAVHNAVMPVVDSNARQERFFNEKLVTFLGRVTFQKGPDYFVEAAYKVLQKDDNVRFVMAGTGDMLPKIIKRVAQLRIASKFHFTGFLKGAEVERIFGLSDVYVMPSVSEPFGISPLEALRSSVPVIISRQSGVAEILRHSLKVDFWDVDAIADRIYALLHYQGITKMFVKYGKAEVEKLKWDDAAAKVKGIYQEVMSTN